jgi:hypothetical protein
MGLFSRVLRKLQAKKGIAPRMPRGGFAKGLFRRKPLGIEKLVNRDSNIDFGIDFSRRSGSGGFRPIGDGRLAPISGSVNPGFNMEPKDPQKRTALQDAFARFREQLRNQQQPQPLQEVDMSGVGTLPLKNLRLPDFLQRVPNPMENLPNLNIPTGIQNLKFSPDFGNYVPMFNKGTDVNIKDILNESGTVISNKDRQEFEMLPPDSAYYPMSELRASQLIFSLNSQAENLMNQMLMEERNGEIERAMETGRQIQNINDEIAEIKGKVGQSKYMMDVIRPGFSGGGDVEIDETVATASRIKKPTTVLTDFSDPLVDVEQEELLADLVEKAELQSLIEELLEDRGRTVSDLDMMTILQQSSSGQPSMV